MSKRSSEYKKYLASQIGFKDDAFLSEYLNETSIEKLSEELNLRKGKIQLLPSTDFKKILATDIENFTYCPVAYSIGKTFVLPKSKEAETGTELHEEQLLVEREQREPSLKQEARENYSVSNFQQDRKTENYINEENQFLFDDLQNSELIFPLEEDIEKGKDFKNGNYTGKPDYIFRNKLTNTFFVVEEKFHFLASDGTFYPNHTNQLRSYLFGIKEFHLEYGYLVYWKYDWNHYPDGIEPKIESCHVKKVERNEEERQKLLQISGALRSFTESKALSFLQENRVSKKCANCVATSLCGHKTGRFKEVSLPYKLEWTKAYFAPFPESLLKTEKMDELYLDDDSLLYTDIFKQHQKYFLYDHPEFADVLKGNKAKAIWRVDNARLYLISLDVVDENTHYVANENLKAIKTNRLLARWVSGQAMLYVKLDIEPEEEDPDADVFQKSNMTFVNGVMKTFETQREEVSILK